MIGKLKKIVGTDGESGGLGGALSVPSGVKVMGAHLQRKFARGVQYNMKVIIKGERNTGKSTLLYRLQGYKFVSEYAATDEIQVAVIHWTAATSPDVVKVDVWDIVDKGKSRNKSKGLKLTNEPSIDESGPPCDPCLDADFLDVYQGTHAVIFIFDVTKKWTYDYVIKNLPLVPHEIPVLVMANFMDNQENRVVSENTGMRLLRSAANRPLVAAPVVVIESSLKDGFGLKMVHQFFNLPFLALQRKSLQQMLETNKQNQIKINQFFSNLDENKDTDYNGFLRKVEERKTNKASVSSPDNMLSPSHSAIFNAASTNGSPSRQVSSGNASGQQKPTSSEGFGSKLTRMFSKRQKNEAPKDVNSNQPGNLDEFLSGNPGEEIANGVSGKHEDNSDEDNDNPMVDAFYEDVVSDENRFVDVSDAERETKDETKSVQKKKQKAISSSSDEENVSKILNAEEVEALNAEPDFIFVADVSPEHNVSSLPSPKVRKDSIGSESSTEKQYHPRPQLQPSKSSPKKSVNSKAKSNKQADKRKKGDKKKKRKAVEESGDDSGSGGRAEDEGGVGGGYSTTTSEGGEVPSDSDVSLPSEDSDGDDNFKHYIRSQVRPQLQSTDAVVSGNALIPKQLRIPTRSKKNSEKKLVDSSPSSSDEERSKHCNVKTKKNKVAVSNEKSSVVPDAVPLVDVNDDNQLDEFLSGAGGNVTSYPSLQGVQNTILPLDNSEKPVLPPRSTVLPADGDVEHTESSLVSPDLNLMLNSGDLDFLEAAAIAEPDGLKSSEILTSKEKRKPKKNTEAENEVEDIKSNKKSAKSKGSDKGTKKSSKSKSQKESVVLLDFDDPTLDSGTLPEEFLETDAKKATKKKKQNVSEKQSGKNLKKGKKKLVADDSSSEENNKLSQIENSGQFKNDGYESL